MFDAFLYLSCSKLCQHNWCRPTHEPDCYHTIHTTACKQKVNKPPLNLNAHLYCCQVITAVFIKTPCLHFKDLNMHLVSYCILLVFDGGIYFLIHYPTRDPQRRLGLLYLSSLLNDIRLLVNIIQSQHKSLLHVDELPNWSGYSWTGWTYSYRPACIIAAIKCKCVIILYSMTDLL